MPAICIQLQAFHKLINIHFIYFIFEGLSRNILITGEDEDSEMIDMEDDEFDE
jgi:hypothetical protein